MRLSIGVSIGSVRVLNVLVSLPLYAGVCCCCLLWGRYEGPMPASWAVKDVYAYRLAVGGFHVVPWFGAESVERWLRAFATYKTCCERRISAV